MSLLPLLVVAFGAAGLSLLLGRRPQVSAAVGMIGLALVLVLAMAWTPNGEVAGREVLAGGPYVRLFLVLGCACALLLALMLISLPAVAAGQAHPAQGSATAVLAGEGSLRTTILRGHTEFAAGALLLLGSSAVALDLGSPLPALLATSAAGFAGLVALGTGHSTASQAGVGLRSLRGLGIAVALAIVSGGALLAASDPLAGRPFAVGPAYLVLAGAVALRLGAIPFHGMVVEPHVGGFPLAVPLLFVWGPIALAIVVMATLGSILPPLQLPLSAERGIVVAAGVLSLILGAVAAAVQDDLDHIVAYSIVQDGGLVLLALAAFDPPAWGSARIWFLVFALAKTAFVAWAIVLRRTIGTGDIGELSGWARRAPLLAVALGGIALATVGLPGLAVFEARQVLIHRAMTDPFATIVILGGLLSLFYYGRLLVIGLGPPSPLVAATPAWVPGRRSGGATAGTRQVATDTAASVPPVTAEPPTRGASATPSAARSTATSSSGSNTRDSSARPPSGRPAQPFTANRRPSSTQSRSSGVASGDSEASAGGTGTARNTGSTSSSGGRPDQRRTGATRVQATRTRATPAGRPLRSELLLMVDRFRLAWRSSGAPIAAAFVLVMSLLAVVAGGGGFGLAEAAPADQPVPFDGGGFPGNSAAPTGSAAGSQAPTATSSASATARPTAASSPKASAASKAPASPKSAPKASATP